MEKIQTIETWGVIYKEERVKSLESSILENSLVLENKGAFPGYFGNNLPDPKSPRSLFIITDKKYDETFLARSLREIAAAMQHKCKGTFGELIVKGEKYYCIRIKNLDCFPDILNIQMAISKKGIGFSRFQLIDEKVLIRIHKSFLISRIDEGIYQDLAEANRYYFAIPTTMDWEKFKKITLSVKSNIDNNLFDAALGYFWRFEGISDIIRIYDEKKDLERIKTIRDKYLSEINRLSL